MKRYSEILCDVAVIGGGPAGCAVAVYLARAGLSVIVFDDCTKRNSSRTETLSAPAGRELESLGIRGAVNGGGRPSLGVISSWGSSQPQFSDSFERVRAEGAHIHREQFDRKMAESARASGAIVLTGCRLTSFPGRQRGRWRFRSALKAEESHCSCRFLVDATGRLGSSWLRPLAPRIPLDRLVAVLWTGESLSDSKYLIIESIEDGWFYSAASSSARTTVGFLTDSDVLKERTRKISEFWLSRLVRAPRIHDRLAENADLRNLSIVSAATVVRTRTTGPGWCAVGDATFSHDPLSGLGLTYALESAAHASFMIERYLKTGTSLRDYETWISSRLKTYLLQRRDTYSLEQRWLNSRFWQRRVNQSLFSVDVAKAIGAEA